MVCGAAGLDGGRVYFPFLLSPALLQVGANDGTEFGRTVKHRIQGFGPPKIRRARVKDLRIEPQNIEYRILNFES